jgi:outer membrane protein assembly factor BamA
LSINHLKQFISNYVLLFMRFILVIFTVLISFGLHSQKTFSISFTTENIKKVKENYTKEFKDSISAIRYIKEMQTFAVKKGYLLASVDSISVKNKTITVAFFVGEKFNSVKLEIDAEDLPFLKRNSRLNEKYIASIPFNPNDIGKIMRSIHDATTSNGYPFSKVYLEKINFKETDLLAKLVIEKGQLLRFNKINIKGDSSISKLFISSLLDIREGQFFDDSKLRTITKKISQLSFIKEIKPHELLFTKEGVELFLYLQSNPISSVNGAVGLQPNPITNRVGLTGELNLKLLNVLHRGESMNLSWRSIQEKTQVLNSKINYPFLFKSPFGIDFHFQLYKRDTSFLELKSTLGVQYFLKGGNFIKVFYQNNSSSLLSGGKNNPVFSNLSSWRTNAYGISALKRQVDYLPNPSKGMILQLEIAIGTRKSQVSDTISATKSTTYRSFLQIEWFIPITARHILRLGNTSEFYYAPAFYQNEVYRFGGQSSMRGFNEEELYGTYRSVFTLEYRYLLDKNSHLFAFFDQGLYENNAVKYYKDRPFGFGAGFSFGTNIGIFSISYALGKQFDDAIKFSSGKVHFGYIAYF